MADAARKRPPDFIYDTIGEVGSWQWFIVILLSISKFSVAFHQLANIFLAATVDFHCESPPEITDACAPECKKVWYDRSTFDETIITEWDLICDKTHYPNIAQSLVMLGILTGNITFGIWSDRRGRRPPLLFAAVLQLIAGVAAAFAPWFWLFVFLRFLTGVATGGNMITAYCVIMEIIGPARRELIANTVHFIPFFVGHASLALIAYYIRHFRTYQFAISIFSLIYLTYFCFIPESPRWLMLVGRLEQSTKILVRAAKCNRMPTEGIAAQVEAASKARAAQASAKKGNIFDLLRTPRLRRNSLCIFMNWFAVGFNYFGIASYVGHLGGNIFLNVAISGLFSIPGVIISVPACRYLGRRLALLLTDFVIGTCLLVYIFIPESQGVAKLLLVSVALFAGSACFTICYLIAAEVFPTVARNAGAGVSSMLARTGAMIAAFGSSLKEIAPWAPPLVFAVISFIAFACALLLPETKNQPLPETLEDAENYGTKKD